MLLFFSITLSFYVILIKINTPIMNDYPYRSHVAVCCGEQKLSVSSANKWNSTLLLLALFLSSTVYTHAGKAGLMITMAAGGDKGELYKIHDTWQPFRISNRDTFKWSGILKEMKAVGCEVVILDMTNLGQVRIMENALSVRDHLDGMKYATFVTSHSHALQRDMTIVELANLQAKDIWDMMAQDPTVYEYWGDKPLMIVWADEDYFTRVYNESPPEHKTYIDKFRIGYSESSENGHTKDHFAKDSFAYRTVGGHLKVRQCAPTFGYNSATWTRKTKEEYRADCEWVKMATDYSVYGSWTLSDGMMMGVVNTEGLSDYKNRYPDVTDPYYYADVLRSVLKGIPVGKTVALNLPQTGKYICADIEKNSVANPLFAIAPSVGDLETFKVLDATERGTDNIGIYNQALGKYLRNAGGLMECSGTHMGGSNCFKWIDRGNGYVSLRSSAYAGKFVSALNQENQLVATEPNVDAANTTFTYKIIDDREFVSFENVSRRHLALGGSGIGTRTLPSGVVTVDSQWVPEYIDDTWFFLRHRSSNSLLQNFNDSTIATATAPGAWRNSSVTTAQVLWRLVDTGSGWYRLQNKRTSKFISGNMNQGALSMVNAEHVDDSTLWRMVYPDPKGSETLVFAKSLQTKGFIINSQDPSTASYTTDIVSGNFLINVTFFAKSVGNGEGQLKKDNFGNLCITTGNPDFIDGDDMLKISYQINWYAGPSRLVSVSDGFTGYAGRSLTDVSRNGVLISTNFDSDAFDNGTIFQSGDQVGGSDPRIRLGTFNFEAVMTTVDVSLYAVISAEDFNIINDSSHKASVTRDITSNGVTANVTFTVESTGRNSGMLRVETGNNPYGAIAISSANGNFIDRGDELTVNYVINSIRGASGMSIASEGFSGFYGHSLSDASVDKQLVSSGFQIYPFYNGSKFQSGNRAGGSDQRIRIGGFYFELDLLK